MRPLIRTRTADWNTTSSLTRSMYEPLTKSLTSQARVERIVLAYRLVSDKLRGDVTLEALGKLFDATKHPSVLTGAETPKVCFDSFIAAWGPIDPFKNISEGLFVDFYCVSCP